MKLSTKKVKEFQELVWSFYDKNKRSELPWRKNITPYNILVSEVMLQQTQVSRVIEKFNAWMIKFPNTKSLANASRKEILLMWQGLGYNNRALRLFEAAKKVQSEYGGEIPRNRTQLENLPGIGSYTSAAIMAFAYNISEDVLDTNIRRIYIHHFFKGSKKVSDKEISPLVFVTIPEGRSREWFWALMDYGSFLGKTLKENPNKKSKHYVKQSKFEGSDRQLRSAIVKKALAGKLTVEEVLAMDESEERMGKILDSLEKDLLVIVQNGLVLIGD